MKKLTLIMLAALATSLASCKKEHHSDAPENNIETRAAALGFGDVQTYRDHVRQECAAGNHANCDVATDGTHQACGDRTHNGQCHDGTPHQGANHGTDGGYHGGNGNGGGQGNGGHHGGR